MTGLREQIRALHAPVGAYLECAGCDGGDYYEPSWPCRTAALVYTPDEISREKARYEEGRKQRVAKQPTLLPSEVSDAILKTFQRQGSIAEIHGRISGRINRNEP